MFESKNMKKITITIILLGLSLIFSGCAVKKPLANSNQPAVTADQNINDNTPTTNIDASALRIVRRVPEGTTSGLVDESKVVLEELKSVSVFFNNSIDKKSISDDTFYALWGIEYKVPGTIVYNDELKEITLIFNKTLTGGNPGQETGITVVVDGVKDIYGNVFGKFIYNIYIRK